MSDEAEKKKNELQKPIVKKNEHKLSVHAKAYEPKKNRQTSSAQDRYNVHRINYNQPQAYKNPEPPIDENSDFTTLQHLIISVTYDPGLFDEIVDEFMATLNYNQEDPLMISSVAEFLFSHAVDQASFRYNGARLSTLIQGTCPTFVDQLLKLSQKIDKPTPGYILFLAELYVQHNIFASTLYTSVQKLLAQGGDENVKTVCQTLKLSGRLLELHSKEQMDCIMDTLESSKNSVLINIVNLIESVKTLRLDNWGQNSSMDEPDVIEQASDDRFLAAECGDKNICDKNDDPDDLYNPEPEMDEEIRAGFREFVQMSKKNQK